MAKATRGVTVQLGGEERVLWLNFAAQRQLGFRGINDVEALTKLAERMDTDFDAVAEYFQAALAHEGRNETIPQIRKLIMDLDQEDLEEMVARSLYGRRADPLLAVTRNLLTNLNSSAGTTPSPSPELILDSASPSSGAN